MQMVKWGVQLVASEPSRAPEYYKLLIFDGALSPEERLVVTVSRMRPEFLVFLKDSWGVQAHRLSPNVGNYLSTVRNIQEERRFRKEIKLLPSANKDAMCFL